MADGESGESVASTLMRMATAFEMKTASLMLMPSKKDTSLASLMLETSLHRAFWQRMDELCPLPACALFNAARNSIVPVQWSATGLRQQYKLNNRSEPPELALYAEHKLSHGIVFPISSIDGVRHAFRFDGDRQPLAQAEINDLGMLAMHFLQAYDKARYPLSDDPCGLTERELEVVHWSATGKTSSEIARIMLLSDHTVNAYMNNALRKLNCTSRTQLVAKALRMRIIS